MRNTQSSTKSYLGYLCYSHEVEKTERLRYSKVKISIRKRPHVTRICVLHKVVWFLFFLGFSQDINFYHFGRNWEWEGLPWNIYYYEVKPNILKRAIPRILLFSQYFSFSLNSARTFFLLAISFFLSFFQSQGRVLWQYENAIEYARDSFFFSLFHRSDLPVH